MADETVFPVNDSELRGTDRGTPIEPHKSTAVEAPPGVKTRELAYKYGLQAQEARNNEQKGLAQAENRLALEEQKPE